MIVNAKEMRKIQKEMSKSFDKTGCRNLETNINWEQQVTDWKYLENLLEWLDDTGCLTPNGKLFRQYIWKKYVREKVKHN